MDSSSGADGRNVTALNEQQVRASSDVNITREAIYTDLREVNERDKCKCSMIWRGFECEGEIDVCEKLKNSVGACSSLSFGLAGDFPPPPPLPTPKIVETFKI